MLLLALAAYLGSAEPSDLAKRVQVHLGAAAQPWLARNAGKLEKAELRRASAVFEVELNKRGGFTRVRLSLSSGSTKGDTILRSFFQVVPPMRQVPTFIRRARRNIPCVIHLDTQTQPRQAQVTAVCIPRRQAPTVATNDNVTLASPALELFDGWRYEASGELPKATSAFRNAVEQAPDWTLASYALGLNLGRIGRYDEAKPYLKDAAKGRMNPEVRSYLKGKPYAKPAELDEAADEEGDDELMAFGSCERDEAEIFHFIRQHWSELNACITAEIDRAKGSVPDAIPIGLVITPQGPVSEVTIDHRFYRDGGPLLQCVRKALRHKLPKAEGSNCPVQFEVEVKGP